MAQEVTVTWEEHRVGDERCNAGECNEDAFLKQFPYACECGGLIHGEWNEDAYNWDEEYEYYGHFEWCDKCGKTEKTSVVL